MKTLFVINQASDPIGLENQYLLCLAMLNFEHQVNLVFTEDALAHIMNQETTAKQWSALKLYGAEPFYLLKNTTSNQIHEGAQTINNAEFDALKTDMDFVS